MDFHSLRSRYALSSIILGLLVLLATISGHHLITNTREQSAQHIDNRQHLLAQSRLIRGYVWQIREAIGQFLIDPEPQANQDLIFQTIQSANDSTNKLLATQHQMTTSQLAHIRRIASLTTKLKKAAQNLISIRLNTPLQFPSLLMARDNMMPQQQAVFDAFTVALKETGENMKDAWQIQLFKTLVKARYRWSTIISDVRMLIASRLGSSGMKTVVTQEQDVELYIDDFDSIMKKLKKLQTDKRMGFDTTIAIDQINRQSAEWYQGYQMLIDIHNSSKWRNDVVELQQNINPLLESIWQELLVFDATQEQNAENDINRLGRLASQQGSLVWIIAIVGLLFILFGYIAFDRAVLKPMQKLADAFLQEARVGTAAELPDTTSTETRNLIHAFTEMRNQVHTRQQALEHQAEHDALTGLANRHRLYRQLSSMLKNNKRQTDSISLILLDLDRFKEANDALGHHTGDLLLIEVGNRLSDELREHDLVARLGGDEFAILLSNAGELEAKNVCKKILKSFERAFEVQGHQLFVGASLGIAIHPKHGHDAETMIKRADIAMYVAKRNKLGFSFYEPTADNYDSRYLSLAHDLRTALNDSTLNLAYQLKYDIAINQPVGAEALLRWKHPQHGDISPVNIVPLAEQLGIVNRLTSWVMNEAIAQCAAWRKQGIFISVAVNLSVYDLLTVELIDRISELLERYQVPASYLVIEVTENAMLIDPANAINILQRLDKMGLRIAIDDFGTGFSSLNYLKQLPVDELKIDKSFVIDMITNENDALIVRSTIELAHNLGLKVVAEGVESNDIYELLSILGCDTAQGYHLSMPESPDVITEQLARFQQGLSPPIAS